MSRLKDELAHQLERLVDHLRGANEPATCCHCGEPNIEYAVRQDGEHPADSEVYCAAALDDGNWGPGLLKARIAGPGEHLTWREFNCRLLATTNEWEPIAAQDGQVTA